MSSARWPLRSSTAWPSACCETCCDACAIDGGRLAQWARRGVAVGWAGAAGGAHVRARARACVLCVCACVREGMGGVAT
eukprot:2381720-Prymnesium_polylepis.1